MDDKIPSIEQFAAFLEGNLSESEMRHFSHLVNYNEMLHRLFDASLLVDEAIAAFTDEDLQLPQEIASSNFDLPEIGNIDDISHIDDNISDNDHFRMDIQSSQTYDDSFNSHNSEPFHELFESENIVSEAGESLAEFNNNLNFLDGATGNLGLDNNTTTFDTLHDNEDFNMGE